MVSLENLVSLSPAVVASPLHLGTAKVAVGVVHVHRVLWVVGPPARVVENILSNAPKIVLVPEPEAEDGLDGAAEMECYPVGDGRSVCVETIRIHLRGRRSEAALSSTPSPGPLSPALPGVPRTNPAKAPRQSRFRWRRVAVV